MSYFWLAQFRRLFPLIAVGGYVVCAATVVLALPPDLEKQVRSGNLTRQEAEQIARMSGSMSSTAPTSSAPTPTQASPSASQEQTPQRPRVDEKALLARAEKAIEDYSGDDRRLYKAKDDIEQVLAANPNNALAYVDLARLVLSAGYISGDSYEPSALQMAHASLEKAFKLNPRLFEVYITGGYLAYAEKDMATARKMTATAEKLKPGTPEVAIRYAEIANVENKSDEAIAQLDIALRRPLSKRWKKVAYREMLTAYKAKKDYRQADYYHQATLAIDPSPWAKINYASFLGCSCGGGDPENRDYDKAISYGESALKEMNFPMAHTVLGQLYYNRAILRNSQGHKNWAMSDFKQAAQHYKENEDKESIQRVQAKMQELNLGIL